jgi:hypothetical protein
MSGIWKAWMQVWSLGVVGFGLLLALAGHPATDAPARLFYDLIFHANGAPVQFESPAERLTVCILGCVMIGWGFTVLAIARQGQGSAPLWRSTTLAVLAWYVSDSMYSLINGAPLNAASNTLLLATYLIPVLASGALRR